MPKKYQRKAGDLQDVARPYCLVRASVIRIYKVTGERKRVREEHRIGFVDEISAKNALQCRAEVLDAVNAERFVA